MSTSTKFDLSHIDKLMGDYVSSHPNFPEVCYISKSVADRIMEHAMAHVRMDSFTKLDSLKIGNLHYNSWWGTIRFEVVPEWHEDYMCFDDKNTYDTYLIEKHLLGADVEDPLYRRSTSEDQQV